MARTLIVIIFIAGGLALGGWNFYKFPWKEAPTRTQYLTTLLICLTIGGGIGVLAGGWLAGRVP
jgi:hypothetical protein